MMDLQGVGAVAAAAVAVVGVLASLLIGRWQLRAALRSAQATHQAGLAQAEATYTAALDAVRAQSDSVHDHWRRGVRREAWSSFLLASEAVTAHANEMLNGADADDVTLSAAWRDVKRAFVVLELEGPLVVIEAAAELMACCEELISLATQDGFGARVWRRFYSALDDERRAVARMEQLATPVHDAFSALGQLQHALQRVREAHTSVIRSSAHARPGTTAALSSYVPLPDALMADPQIAYEALERSYESAVSCLREVLGMPAQEVEVLLRDTMDDGRIAMLDLMAGEYTRLDVARREFLAAARHALDDELLSSRTPSSGPGTTGGGSAAERM
ncbi:hypothetical protein [Streptomyces sp. SudanB182_2057]|uniref:hypothetical protein n=1 Tax=Streptomyces sp. SudanB182_2057 TaxID=3035281 RepID=UPI003F564F37